MNKIFMIFLVLVSSAQAAEQIVRPYQSVRSSGMGGTRITTGLYEDNFFGNPARATANPKWKVQIIDISTEFTSGTLQTVRDLTGNGDKLTKVASTSGNNNHARVQTAFPSFYLPNVGGSKWSYGFGVLMSTQADIGLRRSYNLDPDITTDIGPAATIARKLLEDDRLSVGITPHLTYRLSSDATYSFINLIQGRSLSASQGGKEGAHIDIDAGATYNLHWKPFQVWELQAGASINNILGGGYKNMGLDLIKSIGGPPRRQPRTYNVGIAARKKQMWKFTDTVVAFEIQDIGNNANGSYFRTFHLGFECRYGVLLPRLGINQGYLGGGLGVDLKFFTLDLATYGEELSLNPGQLQDRRYAARIAFQI